MVVTLSVHLLWMVVWDSSYFSINLKASKSELSFSKDEKRIHPYTSVDGFWYQLYSGVCVQINWDIFFSHIVFDHVDEQQC